MKLNKMILIDFPELSQGFYINKLRQRHFNDFLDNLCRFGFRFPSDKFDHAEGSWLSASSRNNNNNYCRSSCSKLTFVTILPNAETAQISHQHPSWPSGAGKVAARGVARAIYESHFLWLNHASLLACSLLAWLSYIISVSQSLGL